MRLVEEKVNDPRCRSDIIFSRERVSEAGY